MSEISRYGSGERGVFKLPEKARAERPKNLEIAAKESERGAWWWNHEKNSIEPFTGGQTKVQTHYIQTDTIEPVESYATEDRRMFDSRSALDRHYKEHGYERVSKEDIKQRKLPERKYDPREHREHWERAENDLRYGNVELTEYEKEVCRRENRMLKAYQEGSRDDHMMEKFKD